MSTATPSTGSAVSYKVLFHSLSSKRFAAYSLATDVDSVDGATRYLWNMALGAAITPILHMLEIAFRNALYEVGCETTAGRGLSTGSVPCWLDTVPSLLQPREADEVAKAIERLGKSPRRRTPGHLVAQLGFGFWVSLCERPYEHGRATGPQLWPRAVKRFQNAPKQERNRPGIRGAMNELREFRNLVAHHHPIWDRDPVRWHTRAVEVLGWMNPRLAAVAHAQSPLEAVYNAGPGVFRAEVEKSLYI